MRLLRCCWAVFAISLCVFVSLTPPVSADAPLRVNREQSKAAFLSESKDVVLAIENATSRAVRARIRVEILDPQNRLRAHAERDEAIAAGLHLATFDLSLKELFAQEREALLWYRLRYRLTTAADSCTGIISLSEITPDFFELRVAAPFAATAETLYRTHLVAVHPVTAKPVSGVRVSGRIVSEDDEEEPEAKRLQATGVTDESGYATLDFRLPPKYVYEGIRLEFTGERLGLTQTVDGDLPTLGYRQFVINSDKRLYQPEQTMHLRALLFDTQRRALADAEVTLKIADETGAVVHRARLRTSRFGVAVADWQIPASIRLGEYDVRFLAGDDSESFEHPAYTVRISRYELPNFTVQAQTDRSFYLPRQNAEVVVRGDYLFGEAVRRARVRVVRETERRWNFREQRWDIEEEESQQGELAADGRFVARLDLSNAHDELADDDYQQFKDVTYTAYLTDLTTNRTEQRRFDVRVTREPIHLQLIARDGARDVETEFYLSTFYADGTPARCVVTLSEVAMDGEPSAERLTSPRRQTVQTNRYGVAKVSRVIISQRDEESYEVRFQLLARDERGRTGSQKKTLWLRHTTGVCVRTDKPIYRPGENLQVSIAASRTIPQIFVEAVIDAQVIYSRVVAPQNGYAAIRIPYDEKFKGVVNVRAYSSTAGKVSRWECPFGYVNVLYPHDRELQITATTTQTSYGPGEEVRARVQVSGQGGGLESVLGVTVFDAAVEERVRTDSEGKARRNNWVDASSLESRNDGQIAGISLQTLNQLDRSTSLPEDLRLVAELLLQDVGGQTVTHLMSDKADEDLHSSFRAVMDAQLRPLLRALDTHYRRSGEYPTNGAQLRRILAAFNLNPDDLRDPWGTAYRERFAVERQYKELQLASAGADQKFGTEDDLFAASAKWEYFKPYGEILDRVVQSYHQRTGRYLRDLDTLRRELRRAGVRLSDWRDPWGNPYHFSFGVERTRFSVIVNCQGANRKADWHNRNFVIWTSRTDYTVEMRERIGAALDQEFKTTGQFPQNETEFAALLQAAGVRLSDWRDGWGNPYYVTFKRRAFYTDRARTYLHAHAGGQTERRTELTPVTQYLNFIYLRSRGADGKENTADDFNAAEFSRILAEQSAGREATTRAAAWTATAVLFAGAQGAIAGIVTDAQGGVIPGAVIKVTRPAANQELGRVFETQSGDDGRFVLGNLPLGFYEVRFAVQGFKDTVISDVLVTANSVTKIDVVLEAGTITESVVVSAVAAESLIETSNASMEYSIEARKVMALPSRDEKPGDKKTDKKADKKDASATAMAGQLVTPRLRDYFPETLSWQPEIVTDAGGQAEVKFRLADNLTTWKLTAIASTVDGRIGVIEREIRAFQPFFIEHDPPPVLTVGDEIALPVVLRNYLARAQRLDVELRPENWFAINGAAKKTALVEAGDARRETFDIRALAPIKAGKQRLTALGVEASDAVEKSLTVRPDGEEVAQTAAQVFDETTTLRVTFPTAALADSLSGELKIYPNLAAHVLESIEAILQRPYGCGEQTISSAYPSLLALRLLQQQDDNASPLARKARRYVQSGYERLLNYRSNDGGFSYWGRGAADTALSAYALKFLRDAAEFIAVEEEVLEKLREYLLKQQAGDGSWVVPHGSNEAKLRATILLTAYIARVLAESGGADDKTHSATARALAYLKSPVEQFDEPYLLASLTLAMRRAPQTAAIESEVARLTERLRRLGRDDATQTYWALETNTPFYGWGLAGRIETTALALQALAAKPSTGEDDATRRALNRGLLFLLKNKDRYGVWHSTQATINVLETLVVLLSRNPAAARLTSDKDLAEVIVNGRTVERLEMPAGNQPVNPLVINVTPFLSRGENLVEIRRRTPASTASAQLVTAHYHPWATNDKARAVSQANALRLAVQFDKREAQIGEAITCTVAAERVGFQGYGMMLAEIGLPPGADVDRASLDRALEASGWAISQYDVLPDRLIVYLWARAGGTQFAFKFRPRFAMRAKAAASLLYDYYNPEAQTVVAPAGFIVR